MFIKIFLYRKLEQRAGSPGPGPAGQGEHHPVTAPGDTETQAPP